MGSRITYNGKQIDRLLKKLGGVIEDRQGLLLAVGNWLLKITRDTFGRQRDPAGIPWKALSQPYGQLKARGLGKTGPGKFKKRAQQKKKLQRTGALLRDVSKVEVTGKGVSVGSDLPYAAAHNFGATLHIPEIVAKPGQVFRFFDGNLNAVFAKKIKAHTVVIPQRRFLPTPAEAEREAREIVEEHIQDQIVQIGAS